MELNDKNVREFLCEKIKSGDIIPLMGIPDNILLQLDGEQQAKATAKIYYPLPQNATVKTYSEQGIISHDCDSGSLLFFDDLGNLDVIELNGSHKSIYELNNNINDTINRAIFELPADFTADEVIKQNINKRHFAPIPVTQNNMFLYSTALAAAAIPFGTIVNKGKQYMFINVADKELFLAVNGKIKDINENEISHIMKEKESFANKLTAQIEIAKEEAQKDGAVKRMAPIGLQMYSLPKLVSISSIGQRSGPEVSAVRPDISKHEIERTIENSLESQYQEIQMKQSQSLSSEKGVPDLLDDSADKQPGNQRDLNLNNRNVAPQVREMDQLQAMSLGQLLSAYRSGRISEAQLSDFRAALREEAAEQRDMAGLDEETAMYKRFEEQNRQQSQRDEMYDRDDDDEPVRSLYD